MELIQPMEQSISHDKAYLNNFAGFILYVGHLTVPLFTLL
jgi:hypothetical protein